MKNLTLIRHAEAQTQLLFENDHDRRLTQTGLYQIERIAMQLKEKKCLPDYLLCSPATRAVQTAELICKRLTINPARMSLHPLLYSGDIKDSLQLITSVTLSAHACIIGHNPTLSCLAHTLCPATQSIALPTAGVISLQFDCAHWANLLNQPANLLFFIEPGHE